MSCTGGEYQSYSEGDMAREVEDHVVWSSELPFKGSDKLAIDVVDNDELLISDSESGYQLAKIVRSDGSVSKKYLKLRNGAKHSWYAGRLIVSAVKDGTTTFHMVDYDKLERRYSSTINHNEQSDFSIPGQRVSGKTLILYYSDFNFRRYEYTDYMKQMKYSIPYLEQARFSFYLLNMDNGQILKYEDIQDNRLGHLNGICARALAAAKNHAMMSVPETPDIKQFLKDNPEFRRLMKEWRENEGLPEEPEEYDLEDYLYYIENVFLVDSGRKFVFVLANHQKDRHYYALDLKEGTRSIEERSALEMALLYDELMVEYDEKRKDGQGRGYVKISGMEYKIDHIAFFRGGIVFAARTRADEQEEKTGLWARFRKHRFSSRVIRVGLKMDRKWEQKFEMPHRIGELIEDHYNNIVYVPCISSENKYVLLGLNVDDGSPRGSLPANFRTDIISNNSYLYVSGTEYDFSDRKMYIHDIKKNAIVCSKFRR
jgi:hypothetical protein